MKRTGKYLVLVYGRNFWLTFEDRRRAVVRRTGFYAWRCVRAADHREAEYRAMDMIRGDKKLRETVRNPRTDPPIMHALEIHRVRTYAPFRAPGSGYTFFHGRGAGRPRKLKLASDAKIPPDMRRALRGRYGA
jgi:hypothetical protein